MEADQALLFASSCWTDPACMDYRWAAEAVAVEGTDYRCWYRLSRQGEPGATSLRALSPHWDRLQRESPLILVLSRLPMVLPVFGSPISSGY